MTSVLFADLVGFTPLAESRDPEEVRELLTAYFDRCRTVIGRYGGTVEKFIGDAVMAVWGVPLAREDDAQRAVRAGLELVASVDAMGDLVGIAGLMMRVGVVTGEVAVTVGASEGMVAGDAVNTASRIQALAEPGHVWVDEATRELTSGSVEYVDVGHHALKGKAEAVRIWQARAVVAEVGGGRRMDGLEAPMAGRIGELRLVKDLFHATAESGRPRLVVLDGEAGLGKSRLAWEFEKYIDGLAGTVSWHRGRSLSYGDGAAFWALAEAVRVRLGLVDGDSDTSVVDAVDAGLQRYVSDPVAREWIRPRLCVLVGAELPGSYPREDLFAAWTAFLEAVGGDDPVVLVLDDAQFADDGLLDFLEHLLGTARHAVFVLALARPQLLARRPDLGGRRTTVVHLDFLDDAAMAELVDGLVDDLPPLVRDSLVARAEGVPLFAVETVRALIDRDAVVASGGRYVLADPDAVGVDELAAPASLHALVAARLDTLSAAERRLVADASVLGFSFTRDGIDALAAADGGGNGDVDELLVALTHKEIFALDTDRFSAERGRYRFVQSVVRQVAYSTLARRERKARHLCAAAFLAERPDAGDDLAVVIGQHLLDAVDATTGSDDDDASAVTARACAMLERAAARARRLGSPAEAHRLLELVIARSPDPAELGRLLLASAEAADSAGDFAAALLLADRATNSFRVQGRDADAALAQGVAATAQSKSGDNTGAIQRAKPILDALPDGPDTDRARLKLVWALERAHSFLGDYAAHAAVADRLVVLAERVQDFAAMARAQTALGNRYLAQSAPIAAGLAYLAAAQISREHDQPERLSVALNNLMILNGGRDLIAAIGYGREGLAEARRAGSRDMIDSTVGNLTCSLWLSGRLTEASATLEDEADNMIDPAVIPMAGALRGWLAEALGQAPPTLVALQDVDDETALAWQGHLTIRELLARGASSQVAEKVETTLTHLLAAGGIEDDFVHLWPPLVEAAFATGDLDLVERTLDPVASAPPGIVPPAVTAQLHRLRGRLGAARGAEPGDVEADLRTGIAILADLGIAGLAARAEEELADWLRTQGRDDETDQLLDHARATYEQIGARGWLAELDAEAPQRTG